MFQMEHFINMLLYDPKVAKEYHTAVFREVLLHFSTKNLIIKLS